MCHVYIPSYPDRGINLLQKKVCVCVCLWLLHFSICPRNSPKCAELVYIQTKRRMEEWRYDRWIDCHLMTGTWIVKRIRASLMTDLGKWCWRLQFSLFFNRCQAVNFLVNLLWYIGTYAFVTTSERFKWILKNA